MFHSNWKDKMEQKHWDKMQEYKEFNIENYKGIEKFSNIFNRLLDFFGVSLIVIGVVIFLFAIFICISLIKSVSQMYFYH